MVSKFQKIGPVLVIIFALLPLSFWLPLSNWGTIGQVLRSLGQGTVLVGVVLFSINFILSARFRLVENLFFGLNRVFIYHHIIGEWAFILLLCHPTFLLLSYLTISVEAAFSLLVPSIENLPNVFGLASLLTMSILLIITLYIKLHYETWKSTHQWLGLALVLAFLHVFTISSTVTSNLYLRYYILGFIICGLASFIYRMLVKFLRLTSTPYLVSETNIKGDVVEIKMTPVGKPITFIPGQFVFAAIKRIGVRAESHPFSITSSINDAFLSTASKAVGDYTETLKLVTPGAKVFIEGPYGRFSYQYFKNKKQIWIAGGIGITPFLSMLKMVPAEYEVNFYYLVSEESEAVYNDDVIKIVNNKPNIKYKLHVSKKDGHLEAKNLAETFPGIGEYEIFICGPVALMYSLKKQFIDLGVRSSRIHTEEFALN